MSLSEQIFKGQYEYYKGSSVYAQENFSIKREDNPANLIYSSEILSRASTGEFLKVYVDYEVTPGFDPLNVKIRKSLGEKNTKEAYSYNYQNKNLTYTFTDNEGKRDKYEKQINVKFQIATPAFLTSLLFTQSKKVDSIGRTQYMMVKSHNNWTFEAPFVENLFWLENKSQDSREVTINGQKLQAMTFHLYRSDVAGDPGEEPIVYFQSKNVGIPYQVDMPDGISVKIKFLNHTESNYKGMF